MELDIQLLIREPLREYGALQDEVAGILNAAKKEADMLLGKCSPSMRYALASGAGDKALVTKLDALVEQVERQIDEAEATFAHKHRPSR